MESALRDAPDDLRLIETALWDGAACPLLARHLARMAEGARALGWAFDPQAAAAFSGSGHPARLRVLHGPGGIASVETSALPTPIALWRVGIAVQKLRSGDPWLRVKSTRRECYDAARRDLAPGLHEAILLNERDEVCDGSITTVFFDRGDGLCTPPLSSGVLPGVLRAELLSQGAREAVLMAADLPNVRLWVGNALRGMCSAELVRPEPQHPTIAASEAPDSKAPGDP